MTQAVTTLYDKLGGEKAIHAVVDEFYKRVLGDKELKPYFASTDMERQKDHQRRFITMALGGPQRYSGRSMKKAHQGLGITENHFGKVAGHLVATLESVGVSKEDVNVVVGVIGPLKDDIVEA